MQEVFVDPDISRIIFGTLSLSEVIISNSYLNLDKFRLLRTELSNKNRRGRIQQTNSKYQGNIPAYNIKWNTEDTGLWYDKTSIESDLISKI